jgi:hypothetical protein
MRGYRLFIDIIYVLFCGRMFQQTIGIPMSTNCASLLPDLFLRAYQAEFLQVVLDYKERK